MRKDARRSGFPQEPQALLFAILLWRRPPVRALDNVVKHGVHHEDPHCADKGSNLVHIYETAGIQYL